jgi:dolichol-phosphate mannosyltransferase
VKTLSVVIPVYYNEHSIPELAEHLVEVEKQLLERTVGLELIFVDDGSGDESLPEVLKFKRRRESTKVVKLTRNFGAIHASKAGLQFVTGDAFLMLAADLQDPLHLIPEIVDIWLKGAKYVVAARKDRKDPVLTKLLSAIYYKLLRFFVVQDYPSKGYDMALMDKVMLPYIKTSAKNINWMLYAYWLGFEPEFVYYTRLGRRYGKSRWTLSKRLKLFLDSLLGFSIAPIRFITVVGLIVSLVSVSYGIWVAVSTLLVERTVPGFATLVALITFLLGQIIIMLGIIGEYLWRIYDETNQRPDVVIEEVF